MEVNFSFHSVVNINNNELEEALITAQRYYIKFYTNQLYAITFDYFNNTRRSIKLSNSVIMIFRHFDFWVSKYLEIFRITDITDIIHESVKAKKK